MSLTKPTKHGMEMLRKTLDILMTPNRNGDRQDAVIQSYRDKRVCKFDLVGICPHTLFSNTKRHIGTCKYECCPVPPKLKRDFQEDLEKGDPLCWKFVKEAEKTYSNLVRKCDEKRTSRQFQLDEQNKKAGYVAPIENEDLQQTIQRMSELTTKIEQLGETGRVDEAQQLFGELESLTKKKAELESDIKPKTNQQELLVCEVCAAILSVNETDQRLADHFAGKSHLGYAKLREKVEELGKKIKEYDENHENNSSGKSFEFSDNRRNHNFSGFKRSRDGFGDYRSREHSPKRRRF